MSDDVGDFEDLFPSEPPELRTAIGTQESILREALGNERFESMIRFEDASAAATLETNNAISSRLRAVAHAYDSFSSSMTVLVLLAICWSIFFWVIWALR